MREIIELRDCPVLLREKVNAYLERFPEVEILSVQKIHGTPYKDKSIIDTSYKVFTLQGNYFCVYKMSVCSKSEFSDRDVTQSCMIAGEIHEIVRLCPDWFKYLNE